MALRPWSSSTVVGLSIEVKMSQRLQNTSVKPLDLPRVAATEPLDEKKIDKRMMEMGGAESRCDFEWHRRVSLAVCEAGAAEKGVPLHRRVAGLAGACSVTL